MSSRSDAWPAVILAELRDHPDSGISVVLDPDALLTLPDDLGVVATATDWIGLRATFESEGRHRSPDQGRLVILLQDPDTRDRRDLPWDIDQRARAVAARFPGSRIWIPLWRELGPVERQRLTSLLGRRREPSPANVIEAVYGVVLPCPDEAAEFDAVARLRLSDGVPEGLWPIVQGLVNGSLSAALAAEPPRTDEVQAAWDGWLRDGATSGHSAVFAKTGASLVGLLTFGLLRPAARTAEDLPAWTAVGTAEVDPIEKVLRLLDQRPAAMSPATLEGWALVAAWWGAVRAAMAEAAPLPVEIVEAAWDVWSEIDAGFGPWITGNLGMLQTSSRAVPSTVDRIAPFLARRSRAGSAKICLLVMDGMGFAQWPLIRDRIGLHVEEAHGVAAVAPTLTPFSRQAIFAGALPVAFPESMTHNNRERERWTSFWTAEEVPARAVRYASTSGASKKDVPSVAGVDVLGVAVLAVDDMLHGATLLGDAEVAASIKVWLDHGFLSTLVANACKAGFEVWLTADHGNLEATAIERLPQEGLAVDRHGERVRLYASATLRDAARAVGFAWQPPGLPPEAAAMLFARGRSAYVHGSDPAVVHGGISLDEVIVPLVRVSL